MHRCYATVIEPVLDALRPDSIAIVGTESGPLTRRIARTAGAALHAVDALAVPGALRDAGPVDLVLLGGDPNWYAVTSALERATAVARAAGREAPVFVVHNVHWPFGRRDGYHDPQRIPAAARHEHTDGGLAPTSRGPVADGIRLTPFVAVSERGARNGVLTAVEDFMAADTEVWQLAEVPGLGGTAVLVGAGRARRQPGLTGLLAELRSAATLRRAARRAEAGRFEALLERVPPPAPAVDADALVAERDAAQAAAAEVRQQLEAVAEAQRVDAVALEAAQARALQLQDEVAGLLEQRARADAAAWRVEMLERDLEQRERERVEAAAARDGQAAAMAQLVPALEQARAELRAQRDGHAEARSRADTAEARVAELEARIAELSETEALLSGRVLHLEDMLQAARAEIDEARDERDVVRRILEEALVDAAEAAAVLHGLRASRRSRAAHGLRRLVRRAARRPATPTALERAIGLVDQRPVLPTTAASLDYRGAPVPTQEKER